MINLPDLCFIFLVEFPLYRIMYKQVIQLFFCRNHLKLKHSNEYYGNEAIVGSTKAANINLSGTTKVMSKFEQQKFKQLVVRLLHFT